MAKRDYIPCACCGETFKQTRDTHIFCSWACYNLNKQPKPKQCLHCNVSFISKINHKSAKYCSNNCLQESRRVQPHTCVTCGTLFTPVKYKPSIGKYRKYTGRHSCSAECAYIAKSKRTAKRMLETRDKWIGQNNPCWTGYTLLKNKSYRGPDWKAIKAKAIKRDGHKCQSCGMTEEQHFAKWGRMLDVHHINPFYNFTDHVLANKLTNLITLCKSCHRVEDGKIQGKQLLMDFGISPRVPSRNHSIGAENGNAKIDENKVKQIRVCILNEIPYKDITEIYGIKRSMISNIKTGKAWKHVS
jgi:5-methylcytosine-specific restriction endonuclease McrA